MWSRHILRFSDNICLVGLKKKQRATNQSSHFQCPDLKLEVLGKEGCMIWYHVLKNWFFFICARNTLIKQ